MEVLWPHIQVFAVIGLTLSFFAGVRHLSLKLKLLFGLRMNPVSSDRRHR